MTLYYKTKDGKMTLIEKIVTHIEIEGVEDANIESGKWTFSTGGDDGRKDV